MLKQNYQVAEAGFVLGQYRQVGEIIPMTPRQTKYLAPPYGTTLKPPEDKKEPAAKPKVEKPGAADKPATKADGEG